MHATVVEYGDRKVEPGERTGEVKTDGDDETSNVAY